MSCLHKPSIFFLIRGCQVAIDIILRESEDLSTGAESRDDFLELLSVILKRSQWRAKSTKYRHEDIVNLLKVRSAAAEASQEVRHRA